MVTERNLIKKSARSGLNFYSAIYQIQNNFR